MNKKFLFLNFAIIITLSLSSCVAKEIKVDNKSGNEMVTTTIDNTVTELKRMSEDGFLSLDTSGSNHTEIKIDLNAYSNDGSTFSHSIVQNSDDSYKLQANINTNGIKAKPIADLSELELYSEVVSKQFISSISTPNPEYNLEETIDKVDKHHYLGNEHSVYLKYNDIVEKDKSTLNVYQVNALALKLQELVNFEIGTIKIGGTGEFNPDDMMEDIKEMFPHADEEEFESKFNGFMEGNISAEEYFIYLNSVSKEPIDTDEEKKEVVEALNYLYVSNPSKFLHYTKVVKDKYTTLSSSFDFAEWKNLVNEHHNSIHIEGESTYDSLSHYMYRLTPETMDLSFSLTINPKGYLETLNYDLNVKGAIPSALLSDLSFVELFGSLDLKYTIVLSGNLSLKFSDERISVSNIAELVTNEQTI